MAKNDDDLDLEVESKKGGGMKKIIILVVVILLVAGGAVAATMMLMGDKESSGEAAGEGGEEAQAEAQPPKRTPHYIDVRPAFVVNLDGDDSVRFLQVSVSLMTYDDGAVEAIGENMPLIKHHLTMLFSSQKYDQIRTIEGKKKLQEDAVKVVRDALTEVTGRPLVDAVYLPNIVGQ